MVPAVFCLLTALIGHHLVLFLHVSSCSKTTPAYGRKTDLCEMVL